ncbi:MULTISPECIES: acyltransferase [Kitasatospora]|uniref:Putative acyltransferase n=1 Tax=Kitasatospora setae (strain ATCC 33774 / DSM 43861 / JCM 3304 / KCC A-0304 / NBRC 14216 / KM-6054) TaxID=452652 RepID=E4N410_KITSK|nr:MULTISPECIES: acyltransferase [Kitasatospora]BAJ25941.1 putative acyltransferase [Kitasatospora setae KM-6054]BAJ33337.1 putative acyltransferase [Kitasatospora setae KM-6054]
MAPAAAPPERLPSLTGTRFLAALLVLAFHASSEGLFADRGTAGVLAALLGKAGWAGVSFFFVLSGFVLAWSAGPHGARPGFRRRRIARIHPAHLVTTLTAMALLVAGGTGLTWAEVVPNLLLAQAWFPQPEIFVSGNPVSWSLSCELLFYLSFPPMWRALCRIRAGRLWWWAGALAAAVVCVPPLAGHLLPGGPVLTMPDGTVTLHQYWFVYVLPPVRALEFVLGAVMARVVREGKWIGLRPLPATALAAAGYAAATRVPYLYGLAAATVVPIALLVAALAHADRTGRRGWLAARPVVRLGELSFALYLVHRLVLGYGHRALGADRGWSTPVAALLVLAALAVSLALAWLLHTLVEIPALRRWARPRPRPAPPRPHPAAPPGPAGHASPN